MSADARNLNERSRAASERSPAALPESARTRDALASDANTASDGARGAALSSQASALPSARALAERVQKLEAELACARSAEARARAALAAEQRVRRIVDALPAGIWALDEDECTTFVNDAMANLIGYAPEQMIGRPLSDFLAEDARASRALEPLTQAGGELNLRHRTGHALWTSVLSCPLEDERGQRGRLALVRDASEKRRVEREQAELSERVLESQKLESLGVLAGGIAHDFNNLLAAIMGQLELASQEAALSPRSRTALTNALAATQRAAGLTRQLLDYAGRSELSLRPLRLGAQVAQLVELLRASIPKRVAIELSTPEPSLSIMADPDRLQQAIMNLILNAVDAYGERAGSVLVRVGGAQIEPNGLASVHSPEPVKPGEYVSLEVADRGQGMSEALLKRIFEPFFTTKRGGRGLGLAATLGTVRTHGGHITVHSQLGQGTRFCIYFPRARGEEPQEAPASAGGEHAPPRFTKTLLVVDDEPMVREFAQRLLESEGYRVIEAASGREALSLLRARLPEIDGVLLDLSMPGMDGDALLSELRSFAPALPVIVHTGHSLESTNERLTAWKLAGVLQKPYRAARLSELVRSLFGDPATK